jgi:hypothetical protein
MRADLQSLRGRPGAVAALAEQVELLLPGSPAGPAAAPAGDPVAAQPDRQLDL